MFNFALALLQAVFHATQVVWLTLHERAIRDGVLIVARPGQRRRQCAAVATIKPVKLARGHIAHAANPAYGFECGVEVEDKSSFFTGTKDG